MAAAVAFYEAAGFERLYGGGGDSFTSFRVGEQFLNLTAEKGDFRFWGRVIFHVDDVDAQYERLLQAGYKPGFTPRDAAWGERYFHILDPDGHEISFARPL